MGDFISEDCKEVIDSMSLRGGGTNKKKKELNCLMIQKT